MRRGKKKQEKTAVTVEGSDVFKNFQRVSGRKEKTIPVCEEFWEHPRVNNGAGDKYTAERVKVNPSANVVINSWYYF